MIQPPLSPLPLAIALAAIAVFFLVGSLRDRVHTARLEARGSDYRFAVYREFHLFMWPLAALCVACWMLAGGSLDALGLTTTPDWRFALGMAAAILLGLYVLRDGVRTRRDEAFRATIRAQLEKSGDLTLMQPQSERQLRAFYGVSFAAGVTEEILFRGFLIAVFALLLPLWLAAIASIAVFVLGHWYQGREGMIRIVPISTILTLLYLGSGSLLPVILLHVAIDVGGGMMIAAARPTFSPAAS